MTYFKVPILSWDHLKVKKEDTENSTCSLDSNCVLLKYKQDMLVGLKPPIYFHDVSRAPIFVSVSLLKSPSFN